MYCMFMVFLFAPFLLTQRWLVFVGGRCESRHSFAPTIVEIAHEVSDQGWVSRRVISACDLVNASYLPTTTPIYDIEIR